MTSRSLTSILLSAFSLGLTSAVSTAETATTINSAFWSDDCDVNKWQYDNDQNTPLKIEDYNIDCLYGPYSTDFKWMGRWFQSAEYFETVEVQVKIWSNCGIDYADASQIYFMNDTNLVWWKRRSSQSSCTGWSQLPVNAGNQGDYWVSAGSCVTNDNWDLACYQWLNLSMNRFDYGLDYTDPFYFRFGMALQLQPSEEWAISNLNITLTGTMAPTQSSTFPTIPPTQSTNSPSDAPTLAPIRSPTSSPTLTPTRSPTSSPTPQRIDCETFDLYQTSSVVQLEDFLSNMTYADILEDTTHELVLLQLNGYDDLDELYNDTTMEIANMTEYAAYETIQFTMEVCVTANVMLFEDIQAVLADAESMAQIAQKVGDRMRLLYKDTQLTMSATDEAIHDDDDNNHGDGGEGDGDDSDDAAVVVMRLSLIFCACICLLV
jgi:hypothetical protein